MSPWTDMTASGESYQTMAGIDPVLDIKYMDAIVNAYTKGENLKDPLISPLFADFKGFPPVYIQVGENEILYSDSLRLYENLKEAGGKAKVDEFPGMWHVFQMSPVKAAKTAMVNVAEFVFDTFNL